MTAAIVGLLARHLLTALSALIVAKGWADESTATQIIGALGTLGAVGWSVINKKNLGALEK